MWRMNWMNLNTLLDLIVYVDMLLKNNLIGFTCVIVEQIWLLHLHWVLEFVILFVLKLNLCICGHMLDH
jgi:hypothetical protein